MTVSSSTSKIIGSGNGVTTSWPFSFKVFDPEHLVVTYTDASGDEATLDPGQYIVSLNADQDASPGGTVTYSPAIASGTKLSILREVPYTQATDLKNQGGFFPEVLERAIDQVVMQVQQVREQLLRAFKLSPSQSAIGELEATDANRANTYVGFDASGALALYTGVASGTAVSVAMAPVVSAASLSAARDAMGVGTADIVNAQLADVPTATLKGRVTGGTGVPEDLTQAQALSLLGAFIGPGHRLTLTTALAVTVADVTAAGTLYWTPWKNNLTPIYNGTAWILAAVPEKSFVLDATNFLSGKNHDVFLDYNAGTPRILLGPAWTNDTTRADAIARDASYGWWVNNASITCRISNNGGTVSKGAGALLYLGTIRCAANGQAEDSMAKRFLWNTYNRVGRALRKAETTNSWSNGGDGSWRQSRASVDNQVEFVRGLDEDVVQVEFKQTAQGTVAGTSIQIGLGLDGVSAPHVDASTALMSLVNTYAGHLSATYRGVPGIGRRFLASLEWSGTGGGGGLTWFGDNGGTTSYHMISGEVRA